MFIARFEVDSSHNIKFNTPGFVEREDRSCTWSDGENLITMHRWSNQSGNNGYIVIWSPCDGYPSVSQFNFTTWPVDYMDETKRLQEVNDWIDLTVNER